MASTSIHDLSAYMNATKRGERRRMVHRQAERDAYDLLRRVWLNPDNTITIPVDPIRVAERLGVDVLVTRLDPEESGAIAVKPGRDPQIFISQEDSHNRRRFSCAHELGHYIRREGQEDEYAYIDYRGPLARQGSDPEEIYANAFAAALLMPKVAVEELLTSATTLAGLAAEFGVSQEAMKWRLTNLHLPMPSRDDLSSIPF